MLQALTCTPLLIAALLAFMVSPVLAREEIRTEKVHFKHGASSATIKGKIKGYEGVDLSLRPARANR